MCSAAPALSRLWRCAHHEAPVGHGAPTEGGRYVLLLPSVLCSRTNLYTPSSFSHQCKEYIKNYRPEDLLFITILSNRTPFSNTSCMYIFLNYCWFSVVLASETYSTVILLSVYTFFFRLYGLLQRLYGYYKVLSVGHCAAHTAGPCCLSVFCIIVSLCIPRSSLCLTPFPLW